MYALTDKTHSSWLEIQRDAEETIRIAQQQIKTLKAAVRVFKINHETGVEWPGNLVAYGNALSGKKRKVVRPTETK